MCADHFHCEQMVSTKNVLHPPPLRFRIEKRFEEEEEKGAQISSTRGVFTSLSILTLSFYPVSPLCRKICPENAINPLYYD